MLHSSKLAGSNIQLNLKVELLERKYLTKRNNMCQTRFLLKVALIVFISYAMVSCNTEDRKIKKALKESAINKGAKYELSEYRVVETILKSNLEDTISSRKISIMVQEELMEMDSIMLNSYIVKRDECKNQKQNTLSYLASSYNSLIRDYQKWIDEQEEKLNEKQTVIDSIRDNIQELESLILAAKTPLVYYVIWHQYNLDNKYIEEKVFLNAEYKVFNP